MYGILAVGAFWGTALFTQWTIERKGGYNMFSEGKDFAKDMLSRGYSYIMKRAGRRYKQKKPKIIKLKERKILTDEQQGVFVPTFTGLSESGLLSSGITPKKTKQIAKPPRQKIGVRQKLRRKLLKNLQKKQKPKEQPNQFRDGKKEAKDEVKQDEEDEFSEESDRESEMEIERLVEQNNGMILQAMKEHDENKAKEQRLIKWSNSNKRYDPFNEKQKLLVGQIL